MADRRRRRQSDGDSEEEILASPAESKRNPNDGSPKGGHSDEFESANEEHEDDSDEYTTDEDDEEEEEDEGESYEGESGEEGINEERQSGDGEEQPAGKVDDDEDTKNPAFVPKRGGFYEHDMRMTMDAEEGEEKKPKKKLWKENDKWLHDRYREDQQTPKSRNELVMEYGYDIRAHNRAPERPPQSAGRPRGNRSENRNRLEDYVPSNNYQDRRPPRRPYQREQNRYSEPREQTYNQDRYANNNFRNEESPPRYQRSLSNEEGDRGPRRGYHNQRRSDRAARNGTGDRREGRTQQGRENYNKPAPRYIEEEAEDERHLSRVEERNESYQHPGFDDEERARRNVPAYRQREGFGRTYRSRGGRGSGRSDRGYRSDRGHGPELGHPSDQGQRSGRSYSDMREKTHNRKVPEREFPPRFQKQFQGVPPQEATVGRVELRPDDEDLEEYVRNYPANTESQKQTSSPAAPESGGSQQGHVVSNNGDSERVSSGGKQVTQTVAEDNQNKTAPRAKKIPTPGGDLAQREARTKRYSSQRQRAGADPVFPEQPPAMAPNVMNVPGTKGDNHPYYNPGYDVRVSSTPGFQAPLMHAPLPGYQLPVSTVGMPTQSAVFQAPPPINSVRPVVSLGTLPPQYALSMAYPQPPHPTFPVQQGPHPVPLQAFPSPTAVPQAAVNNAPPLQAPGNAQGAPGNLPQEMYRGGTTYYNQPPPKPQGTTYYPPELQFKSPHRSPQRRPKAAIPIVDPHEISRKSPEKAHGKSNPRESPHKTSRSSPNKSAPDKRQSSLVKDSQPGGRSGLPREQGGVLEKPANDVSDSTTVATTAIAAGVGGVSKDQSESESRTRETRTPPEKTVKDYYVISTTSEGEHEEVVGGATDTSTRGDNREQDDVQAEKVTVQSEKTQVETEAIGDPGQVSDSKTEIRSEEPATDNATEPETSLTDAVPAQEERESPSTEQQSSSEEAENEREVTPVEASVQDKTADDVDDFVDASDTLTSEPAQDPAVFSPVEGVKDTDKESATEEAVEQGENTSAEQEVDQEVASPTTVTDSAEKEKESSD